MVVDHLSKLFVAVPLLLILFHPFLPNFVTSIVENHSYSTYNVSILLLLYLLIYSFYLAERWRRLAQEAKEESEVSLVRLRNELDQRSKQLSDSAALLQQLLADKSRKRARIRRATAAVTPTAPRRNSRPSTPLPSTAADGLSTPVRESADAVDPASGPDAAGGCKRPRDSSKLAKIAVKARKEVFGVEKKSFASAEVEDTSSKKEDMISSSQVQATERSKLERLGYCIWFSGVAPGGEPYSTATRAKAYHSTERKSVEIETDLVNKDNNIFREPSVSDNSYSLFFAQLCADEMPGKLVVQVAAGGSQVLYLTEAGDVFAANAHVKTSDTTKGNSCHVRRMPPSLVKPLALHKALQGHVVRFIACGTLHSIAVTDDGDIFSWGSGEDGRLGHGDCRDQLNAKKIAGMIGNPVRSVACGGSHTVAVTESGAVWSWGRGRNGRLGSGKTETQLEPRRVSAFDTIATSPIRRVSCGWAFTIALGDAGELYSFGRGTEGQCGLHDAKDQLTPRVLTTLIGSAWDVQQVACGHYHSIALCKSGELFSWGMGEMGQLGDSSGSAYRATPEPVEMPDSVPLSDQVVQISCGAWHSAALTRSGRLLTWGANGGGALGLGHTEHRMVPSAAAHLRPPRCRVKQLVCGPRSTLVLDHGPRIRLQRANRIAEVEASLNNSKRGSNDDDAPHDYIVTTSPAIDRRLDFLQNIQPNLLKESFKEVKKENIIFSRGANSQEYRTPVLRRVGRNRETVSASPTTRRTTPQAVQKSYKFEVKRLQEDERNSREWQDTLLPEWRFCRALPSQGPALAQAVQLARRGIPADLRTQIWPLAIGNEMHVSRDLYEVYRMRASKYRDALAEERRVVQSGDSVQEKKSIFEPVGRESSIRLMEVDLPRTFPALRLFGENDPYFEQLRSLLETYVSYRPDLGYIQGMSYLGAMLCLHLREEGDDAFLAFRCLANFMTKHHLHAFYRMRTKDIENYYNLFSNALESVDRKLSRALKRKDIEPNMYLFPWLQTVFLKTLPFRISSRLWDRFLVEGSCGVSRGSQTNGGGAAVLFKASIAVLKLLSPVLIDAEFDVCMELLTQHPRQRDKWSLLVYCSSNINGGDENCDGETFFREMDSIRLPADIISSLERLQRPNLNFESSQKNLSSRTTTHRQSRKRALSIMLKNLT